MASITITSDFFQFINADGAGVPASIVLGVGVPGPAGAAGPAGPQGDPGPAGPGVAAGGLEGQILVKLSDLSYDTGWIANYATELRIIARNETGSTLSKGTVVYISGASGNKPTLSKAIATGDATSAQTLGLVSADIPQNQNGEVTVRGLLSGLDTSAFPAGSQLYLSGSVAGGVTASKPVAPIHIVYVGIVSRQHATQGQIEVAIQNGWELPELHDVLITSPSNGQVLKYDGASGLWKNQTDLNSGVWGQITGTLSSQTDLSLALAAKYDASNPAGYITNAALTGYATQSYVTSQGYITSSALTPYLLSSTAASTYQTITGMSSYALLSGATFTGDISIQGAGSDLAVRGFNPTSSTQQTLVTPTYISIKSIDSSTPYHLTAGAGTSYGQINLFRSSDGAAIDLQVATGFTPKITISGSISADSIEIRDGKFLTPNATITEPYLRADGNLSSLADASIARSNLGLGTMATQSAGSYALLTGATFTGKVNLASLGASSPSINLGAQCDSAPASATNGDIWISNAASPKLTFRIIGTNFSIPVLNQFNTFTGQMVIDTTSASVAALRVTQRGTGNAIEVEDSTTPDATRFVVDQFGKVGIGVSPDASAAINVDANGVRWNTGGASIQQVSAPVIASGTYDKEIAMTINGVNYRIPCRQV